MNFAVIPAWRHIRHNFIMSVYSSQEAIDTDDGSAYYQTYNNFFAFAANGLKSDFNGHDNRHFRNVYGYVDNCWGHGDKNWFVNNTCVTNNPTGGYSSDCAKGTANCIITAGFLLIVSIEMQKERRIAPEKRFYFILKWPFLLQLEVTWRTPATRSSTRTAPWFRARRTKDATPRRCATRRTRWRRRRQMMSSLPSVRRLLAGSKGGGSVWLHWPGSERERERERERDVRVRAVFNI